MTFTASCAMRGSSPLLDIVALAALPGLTMTPPTISDTASKHSKNISFLSISKNIFGVNRLLNKILTLIVQTKLNLKMS